MFPSLYAVCVFPRLPSKSLPHLPGTPRPTSSLPPGSVKATPAQIRPPSPGNIRPVKKEVRVEPERKDHEKEPQIVANEPPLKGRAPLVKVEETTVEEGTPGEPEAASGKNQLTCDGMWVASTLFIFPSSPPPLLGNWKFYSEANFGTSSYI